MPSETPNSGGSKPDVMQSIVETAPQAPRINITVSPGATLNIILSGRPEEPQR